MKFKWFETNIKPVGGYKLCSKCSESPHYVEVCDWYVPKYTCPKCGRIWYGNEDE